MSARPLRLLMALTGTFLPWSLLLFKIFARNWWRICQCFTSFNQNNKAFLFEVTAGDHTEFHCQRMLPMVTRLTAHSWHEVTSVCHQQNRLSAQQSVGVCVSSAAFCPPAVFFCSVSDLCRGHFNNYIAFFKVFFSVSECYCPLLLRDKPRTNLLSFPQKSLLAVSLLRLRDGRFHERVFFLFHLFYPAFLLAVSAECPGSGCNECLQKSDGLIPSCRTNA